MHSMQKDTVERRENSECLLNIHGIMAFFDQDDQLTSQVMATPFLLNFMGKNI